MQIHFHKIPCSYLTRVPIIMTITVSTSGTLTLLAKDCKTMSIPQCLVQVYLL